MRTASRGINIRRQRPNLYYSITTVAIALILLGVNLLLTIPLFVPLGIPKTVVATAFITVGVAKLLFLNVVRDLHAVRLLLAVGIAGLSFWGLANAQQSLNGMASFQVSILYFTIAALQVPMLREALYADLDGEDEQT